MPAVMRCAECGKDIPEGHRLCAGCGAPAPEGGERAANTSEGIRVCRGCGVVAPPASEECARCGRKLDPFDPCMAPRPAEGAWSLAAVTTFCARCEKPVPLRPRDAEALINCPRCGDAILVDPGDWAEALRFAHAVADLAGPAPPGLPSDLAARNPHRVIGARETFATFPPRDATTLNPLRVAASIGHPTCTRCRERLEVRLPGPRRATTTCPGCGNKEIHVTPTSLLGLSPQLRALIAPADDDRAARPEEWWILFEGPSAMRRTLEDNLVHERLEEAERKERELAERKEREQRLREEAVERERRERMERARAVEAARVRRRRALAAAIAVLVAALGIAAVAVARSGHAPSTPSTRLAPSR